ncbi:MAG: hypothetical protein CME06_15215 [Gemmatimonadetes bacterium]|nr:hypothetical protein [Gemmatimonadota bacterium]
MRSTIDFHIPTKTGLSLALAGVMTAGCSSDTTGVDLAAIERGITEVAVSAGVAAMLGGTQHTLGTLGLALEKQAPTFLIYLPPDYSDANADGYPVLYLLHGFGNDPWTWVQTYGLPQLLDGMIADGTIEPMIVVMPNGMGDLIGSFYTDSVFDEAVGVAVPENVAFGAFKSYILGVMEQVEATYNTSTPTPISLAGLALGDPFSASGRAIGGLSMGGYGATLIAETVPVFSAVLAHSAPLAFSNFLDVDPLIGLSVPQILLAETKALLDADAMNAGSAALIGDENAVFTTFSFALSGAFTPIAGPLAAFDMGAQVALGLGDTTYAALLDPLLFTDPPLSQLDNYQYPLSLVTDSGTPQLDDDIWIGAQLPIDAAGGTVTTVFDDQWLLHHDAQTLMGDALVAGGLLAQDTDFFVDVGDFDDLGLADDVADFVTTAEGALGVGQVTFETFVGGHSDVFADRIPVSLTWLSGIFAEEAE